MGNKYSSVSKEKAEEMIQEKRHYIERYTEIHNKIYNNLKTKHKKIFQEEVLSKFEDETLKNQNIKNKLFEIKETINKEYSKKQCINRNLIGLNFEVYLKNDKEKIGFWYLSKQSFFRHLKNEKYNFWNCGEHADFVEDILNELKINNLRIDADPDHVFNLFQIEDKVFFYDLAYGELIGEFTPEFFYKHCFLFGIKDFSICLNKNTTPGMEKIIKSFNEFSKTNRFEEMLFPRIKKYIESIHYSYNEYDVDKNLKNSFFLKNGFSKQIKANYKEIDIKDLKKSVANFREIHDDRSDIKKENDIFQLKLTDISESFEWLYKS